MSLQIDENLSSISAFAATVQNQSASQSVANTKSTDGDRDSYIPSKETPRSSSDPGKTSPHRNAAELQAAPSVDSSAAIPSDNYNDILTVLQSAQSNLSDSSTSQGTDGSDIQSASGGKGGGGGSTDSSEESTTSYVTINGVTYMEITTISNGVSTVTRTVIGGNNSGDEEA